MSPSERRSRSRSRSPRRLSEKESGRDGKGRQESDRTKHRGRDRRSVSPSRRRSTERHRSSSRSPIRKKRRDSKSRSRSRSKERRRKDRSKSRSRSRSRHREKDSKRRRERSTSSTSGSDDDDDRKKRRKHKDRKRSKSRERKREKKREKKEKKEKKKKAGGSAAQWGKYGIISDLDIYTRAQEFHTWLVEERKINPETISKDQQKKEFSRFVEDFNTATLPHEKYYNMEAYERRMAALRQGEYLPPADDSYDPEADMKAITGAHKKKPVEHESYMSREQLLELRKVQHERIEAGKMKLLGMDVKQNMGVRMDGSMFDD